MNKPGEVKALNTKALEPIGEGGNSRVFRLGGNKVVKVFHKDIRPAMGWSVWTAALVSYMNTSVPGICFP